jgi:hypothetical protein
MSEEVIKQATEALDLMLQAFDPEHPAACTQECFDSSDGHGPEIQEIAKKKAYQALSLLREQPCADEPDDTEISTKPVADTVEQNMSRKPQPKCEKCKDTKKVNVEGTERCLGCNELYPCRSDCPCGTYWRTKPCPDCPDEPADVIINRAKDVTCPFCGEADFDLIGLKHHLNAYCNIYQKVEFP